MAAGAGEHMNPFMRSTDAGNPLGSNHFVESIPQMRKRRAAAQRGEARRFGGEIGLAGSITLAAV